MSEYCEYMWNPNRGHISPGLARSLYNEEAKLDPRDKKLAIKTVRAILRDMPNVDLKQCTDEYITKFLLARKNRTEPAAALIVAYQNQLAHRQDIFGNLTARDPALQRALRAGIPGVLPARDRKGRCVLVILASQWDPIAVPALAVQRAIFLVLEILIQDPRNQHCGFVAVIDWGGFSLRQGGALGAAALRNLISALRGRFPARFKAIHFLSAPLCVQATLALAKPFLDEKTRNKIFLHGNNLSTLHEHLPTDILPAELGGTGPAFNPGLWAEPVIHSAMKEAEVAAILAQKERESGSTENRMEPQTELNVQSESGTETGVERDENTNKETSVQFHEVHAELHESPGIERTSNKLHTPGTSSHSEMKSGHVQKRAPNVEDEEKIFKIEAYDVVDDKNRSSSPRLHSEVSCGIVSFHGNAQRGQEYEDKVDGNDHDKMDIRIDPDGLPDDIESLETSDTNSNEFEMVPSRPESENSKDDSFDIDLQVEKIIIRDGAQSASCSEEASLVT